MIVVNINVAYEWINTSDSNIGTIKNMVDRPFVTS